MQIAQQTFLRARKTFIIYTVLGIGFSVKGYPGDFSENAHFGYCSDVGRAPEPVSRLVAEHSGMSLHNHIPFLIKMDKSPAKCCRKLEILRNCKKK